MERITCDVERGHFGIGDFHAGRVAVLVDHGVDRESFLGGRVRNELDDGLERRERLAAPVDGYI